MIVSINNKAIMLDSMGSDLTVVNAARVSFGKRKEEFDGMSDTKLINYLATHEHTSPFGHCFATFHVTAPVFVARQLVKHKFLRWNEISRRYVSFTPDVYVPLKWRAKADNKKQGSSAEPIADPKKADEIAAVLYQNALLAYEDLLKSGVCEEQARMVLPLGSITEWYWSGSLDAFADMYVLRAASDAQAETREIAIAIGNAMADKFPVSWNALTTRTIGE